MSAGVHLTHRFLAMAQTRSKGSSSSLSNTSLISRLFILESVDVFDLILIILTMKGVGLILHVL